MLDVMLVIEPFGENDMNQYQKTLWEISMALTSKYSSDFILEVCKKHFKQGLSNNEPITLPDDILLSIPKSKGQSAVKTRLREIMDATEIKMSIEDYLMNALDEHLYLQSTHNFFNLLRQQQAVMTQQEKNNLLQKLGNQYKLRIVMQYDKVLPKAGILAYEISQYVSICQLSSYLGYLSKSELLENLHPVALLAQTNYSSFREYGIASTVGLLFYQAHGQHSDDAFYRTAFKTLSYCLNEPYSYWRNLDWNLALED